MLVHVTLSVIWVTSYAPVWVATVTWLHNLPWSNYGTFLAQMVNFRLYVDFFVTAVVIVVAYAAQYYIKYTEQARKVSARRLRN